MSGSAGAAEEERVEREKVREEEGSPRLVIARAACSRLIVGGWRSSCRGAKAAGDPMISRSLRRLVRSSQGK